MALATSLPIFIAGLFLYGFTMFVMSPLNSYITVARGRLSVGRAITLISASYNLGMVLGPWLGGQVGQQFGLRQNYIIAGFVLIISTLIVLFLHAQPIERASHSESANGWLRDRATGITLEPFCWLPSPCTYHNLWRQTSWSSSAASPWNKLACFTQ